MICSVFLWKRHFKSPQDRIKTKVRSICVRKKFKSPETVKFQVFLFGGDKRDRNIKFGRNAIYYIKRHGFVNSFFKKTPANTYQKKRTAVKFCRSPFFAFIYPRNQGLLLRYISVCASTLYMFWQDTLRPYRCRKAGVRRAEE